MEDGSLAVRETTVPLQHLRVLPRCAVAGVGDFTVTLDRGVLPSEEPGDPQVEDRSDERDEIDRQEDGEPVEPKGRLHPPG